MQTVGQVGEKRRKTSSLSLTYLALIGGSDAERGGEDGAVVAGG